jgi:hypothetical protein
MGLTKMVVVKIIYLCQRTYKLFVPQKLDFQCSQLCVSIMHSKF